MEETTRPDMLSRTGAGSLLSPVDVLFGALLAAGGLTVSVVRYTSSVAGTLVRVVLDPPVLPRRLRPRWLLESLAAEGAEHRETSRRDLARLLDATVPSAVELVRRVNVTRLLIRRADVDDVVVKVGLGAAARGLEANALVRGVDVEAGVGQAHVDTVAARVGLDPAARRVDVQAAVGGLHALRSDARKPRLLDDNQ